MKQTVRLIALRTVSHNDKTDILSAYSRELGPMSFAISAGSGREAARRRALLMPMSLVEAVADTAPGRQLARLSQPRLLMPLAGIQTNPVKNAVALLMADLLSAMLRQGQPDSAAWDYVAASLSVLNGLPSRRVANFHLVFVYGLGRLAGIEPDVTTYRPGAVFDMRDGRFRPTPPLHGDFLPPDEAAMVRLLSRMTYANMHGARMSRDLRNRILDLMLRYITMHFVPVDRLRSLDIVRELFC